MMPVDFETHLGLFQVNLKANVRRMVTECVKLPLRKPSSNSTCFALCFIRRFRDQRQEDRTDAFQLTFPAQAPSASPPPPLLIDVLTIESVLGLYMGL